MKMEIVILLTRTAIKGSYMYPRQIYDTVSIKDRNRE